MTFSFITVQKLKIDLMNDIDQTIRIVHVKRGCVKYIKINNIRFMFLIRHRYHFKIKSSFTPPPKKF